MANSGTGLLVTKSKKMQIDRKRGRKERKGGRKETKGGRKAGKPKHNDRDMSQEPTERAPNGQR